jgi:hypothetical protein
MTKATWRLMWGFWILTGCISEASGDGNAGSGSGDARGSEPDDCRRASGACAPGFRCVPLDPERWECVSAQDAEPVYADANLRRADAFDACGGNGAPLCAPGEGDAGEVCVCPGDGGLGGGGGEWPAPDAFVEAAPADATAEWTDSKTLVVTVTEAVEFGPYFFGLAETGNGGGDGWDGEDCIPGVNDDYDICHPVGEDGRLTLTSIHPDEGGSIADLEEGVTTLMSGPRAAGITYVLVRLSEDENCWTWGHDPQHYVEELGCTPLR